jgi:hypothetical protein
VNPTQNSLLQVNGAAQIAGALEIVATTGVFTPRQYTILTTTTGLTGTFSTVSENFASFTSLAYKIVYDAYNVYLNLFSFTLADTQAAVSHVAAKIGRVFNLQSSVVINAMTADCPVFDKNGLCLMVGGRSSSGDSLSSESATVAMAFRMTDHLRAGAYIDQTLGSQTGSDIKLRAGSPVLGAFATWVQNPGKEGFQLRLQAGYGDRKMDVTRSAFGTSETGAGVTSLRTVGVSAELSYDYPVTQNVTVSPYGGLRHIRQSMDAYQELASAGLTAPLSYASISQRSTTALAGIKLQTRIDNKLSLFMRLGLEQDISTSRGALSASGLGGLRDVAFADNAHRTRASVSGGGSYDMDKNQRISAHLSYGTQPFQKTPVLSTMISYQMGF